MQSCIKYPGQVVLIEKENLSRYHETMSNSRIASSDTNRKGELSEDVKFNIKSGRLQGI